VHDLESIARKSLVPKAAFVPWIPNPCFRFCFSRMLIRGVPELQWYDSKRCGWATNNLAQVSYSYTCTQYHLHCQMGLASMQFSIWHDDMPRILRFTGTSTISQHILRLCHKYPDTGTPYRLVCFHWKMRFANIQYLIRYEEMPGILWCTRESWADIVMTNRSLHIWLCLLARRQPKRHWGPVSGYLWHTHSIGWPMIEIPDCLNFEDIRTAAPALPQISKPCLIIRQKYVNIT
jgi:hypothetical protein